MDETGKFKNPELQQRYEDYCVRKLAKGEKPRSPLEWKKASEKWEQARIQGKEFANKQFEAFKEKYSNAQQEITIETIDDDGNVVGLVKENRNEFKGSI